MSAVQEATAPKKTLLPGFGRPLNYIPKADQPDYVGQLFPNALTPSDLDAGRTKKLPLTVRELDMLRFMNSITDKPDWHLKVNDNAISNKWKQEAISSGVDMTQKMADYCIDELRHKASIHAAVNTDNVPPPIVVYTGDVVKSDTAVSSELRAALQKAVKTFEDAIPERLKDWHPGSNDMVWDLVHPSLWPLIYGYSRVLLEGQITTLKDCIDCCGQGEAPPIPSDEDTKDTGETRYYWDTSSTNHAYSKKFQWLPCEVDISGERSKIVSYINNLHPKETLLYELVAELIDGSIPLWNVTLAPFSEDYLPAERRIPYSEVVYDPDPASGPESEGPQREEGESYDDYYERRDGWIRATRKLVYPEPREFKPATGPSSAVFDLRETFGTRGLQVIVKLANIELTPQKPKYEGGSWHVEGHLNEHIVATSLYYYSSQNITTSTLRFRQQINNEDLEAEIGYEQNDSDWLSPIFGCQQDGPAVQELGSVDTKEGRLLTFPNILQHRVGPFELADPSKHGHRKIVALFLVDPHIKVISTAHVPCQQQEWWWEKVMASEKKNVATGRKDDQNRPPVRQVPIELQEGILRDVDFPFDLEKAKELRLELMEERKAFVLKSSEAFMETTISLCEH